MKGVLEYIKKNKKRFVACIALEILFLIIFIILIMKYVPQINENILVFNNMIQESGGSLSKLGVHAAEIRLLESNIENLIMAFLIWVLFFMNIIYGVFFAIVLKNFKSWFIPKFFAVNVMLQGLLWLIFSAIVEIKGFAVGSVVSQEQTKASMYVFFLLAYLIYFLGMIFIVEMRKEKVFKNSWRILKKKWWGLLWRYSVVAILFWVILLISQAPVIMNVGPLPFVLFSLFGTIVLIVYMAGSKIYLIEKIKD